MWLTSASAEVGYYRGPALLEKRELTAYTPDCRLAGLAALTLECRAVSHTTGLLGEESNRTPVVKQVCYHLLQRHATTHVYFSCTSAWAEKYMLKKKKMSLL